MSCKYCSEEKGYHSFDFLGRTTQNDTIYYSRISSAKEYRMNNETIVDFITHMDEASISSWVWIFDCRGLEAIDMPSIKFLQEFTQLVQERYKFVLKHVYILYPNWKINIMITMIQPFLKDETRKRLILCDSPLHLIKTGFNPEQVKSILK
jgi:hypothetical protein